MSQADKKKILRDHAKAVLTMYPEYEEGICEDLFQP